MKFQLVVMKWLYDLVFEKYAQGMVGKWIEGEHLSKSHRGTQFGIWATHEYKTAP